MVVDQNVGAGLDSAGISSESHPGDGQVGAIFIDF